MRNALSLLILFLSTGLAAEPLAMIAPEDVGFSSERLQQVSEFTRRHIDEGMHTGFVTMIARHGKIVYFEAVGNMGVENDQPMQKDTLFRIFSMTKPVVSVAMMMLYEEGRFQLTDRVSKYLPSLGNFGMYKDGETVDAGLEITIEQLLTNTAGLSDRVDHSIAIYQLYQESGLLDSHDLDQFIETLSTLPLRYEPGTRYHYSTVGFDVLGALVEELSGQTLETFFEARIFAPLDMRDTFFSVPDDKLHRFADNHIWNREEQRIDLLAEPVRSAMWSFRDVTYFSAGAGLVSMAMDYMIFCEMLRQGGSYDGVRILGPKTVQFMMLNHLTEEVRNNGAHEFPALHLYPGQSYGLGFGVITNPGISRVISSQGEYHWGGVADTKFWIDPQEDLVVVLMTQLILAPTNTRYEMKVATYQALTELQ